MTDITGTTTSAARTPREPVTVHNITLAEDGTVQIAYLRPEQDVKAVGIVHLHTIMIPAGGEYDDEIQAVHDAIEHLVRDVLQDLPNLEAEPDQ